MTFTGMEELFDVLKKLPPEVTTIIIGTAVGEAVKPLVRLAKQFAPVRTGALKASITSKVVKQKKKGTAIAIMGPARHYFRGSKMVKKGESRKGAEQPSRYAHLVEFGHSTPKGFVSAKPFMRPATAVGTEAVSRLMTLGISKGINKAVKKYRKGNL